MKLSHHLNLAVALVTYVTQPSPATMIVAALAALAVFADALGR